MLRLLFAGGMEKQVALQLAHRCLPVFEGKGLTIGKIDAIDNVSTRNLLRLSAGMGSVDEVIVQGDDGISCSFVTKSIRSDKNLEENQLALVDLMSYYNEVNFYEQDLAARICEAGALCPRPLLVDRREGGVIMICMTKLPGRSFGRNKDQTMAALTWLARLHVLFWGNARADEAVAAGASDQGCFWHFDTRQIELNRMPPQAPLRLAACGIDIRLKVDKMQTICHGDPKGANIMWDECEGVSFCDFQWLGKAPPSKDLAYFVATTASGIISDGEEKTLLRYYHEELCKLLEAQGDEAPEFDAGISSDEDERALLRYYHTELCKLLEAQGDEAPTFEYLWDSYHLAMCDLGRWMEGGLKFGNTKIIFEHVKALLKTLDGGKGLSSEEEYRKRIFEIFPP